LVLAYAWYGRAARRGQESAAESVKRLQLVLSASQLDEAAAKLSPEAEAQP
jgi:TPR repeat protein